MAVTVAIEKITPSIAEEMLQLNTKNRNLKEREIQEMCRDLQSGRWVLNGETIKLGRLNGGRSDDVLIDGQNRLKSIVRSGVTAEIVVVRGLNYVACMRTVDAGAKRTGSDIIKLLRNEKNYALLAGIISWAYRQEHRKGKDRGFTCSHSEMLDYLDNNPRLRDATELAARANKHFRPMKAAPLGAALFHGLSVSEDTTLLFADQVATGENLEAGRPAYVLREWLMRAASATRTPVVDAYPAVINKALIAELEGRAIGKLLYRPDSPFPYVQDAEVIEV